MAATIRVFWKDPAEKPTPADIKSALAEEGVLFGIDDEAIARALEAASGHRSVIAQGSPPKPGVDAIVTLRENPSTARAPRQLENGRVDLHDLQLVHNVVKGQILAEKEPAMPGLPGTNVRGQPVPPKPVHDPPLPAGKNTATTPDGSKLVSLMDGHLMRVQAAGKKFELHVEPTFVLGSSVDIATGNINCIGDCEIRGRVAEGFSVVAGGNIHIKGDCEGSEVTSRNGSITFAHAVRGHNKGRITAAKNIFARFIENATVEAGGDVLVKEHIYHSRIRAGGSITLEDTPAAILGGEISFLKYLSCRELGAEANPRTLVFLGAWQSAEAQKRIEEIEEVRAHLRAQSEALRGALQDMRRLTLEDPEKNKERIGQLAKSAEGFPRLKERISALEEEEKVLAKKVKPLDLKPLVTVAGTLHAGVILAGDGVAELSIKNDRKAVEIMLESSDARRLGFKFRPLGKGEGPRASPDGRSGKPGRG